MKEALEKYGGSSLETMVNILKNNRLTYCFFFQLLNFFYCAYHLFFFGQSEKQLKLEILILK